MENKEFLKWIGIIVIVAIILAVLFVFQGASVKITTDKKEYKAGDTLKVKIKNDSRENICFSSCYPYYWEKKKENWEDYHYVDCPDNNLVDNCVNPKKVKAFELSIPVIDNGLHRLAIPACLGCNLQERFREDQRFYSNDFVIE